MVHIAAARNLGRASNHFQVFDVNAHPGDLLMPAVIASAGSAI
jgi:hypothetical protein